jgi:hypothetical protein
MNSEICRYEARALQAAGSGEWTESLKEHVRDCEHCRVAISIARSLKNVSAGTQMAPPLTSFNLLWIKAELIEKQERLARLELLQKLGILGSVAAGVVLFILTKLFSGTNTAVVAGRGFGVDMLTMILPFVGTAAFLYLMRAVTPDPPARRKS